MSTLKHDEAITCDNDCDMQGCPGHDFHAEYQSTADIYSFHKDGKVIFYADRNTMRAILSSVHEFAFVRVEVENDIEKSGILEPSKKDREGGLQHGE